jgi:hypothetical protein
VLFQQAHLPRYGDADLAVNPAIWITNIIALLLPAVLADAGVDDSRPKDPRSGPKVPHRNNLR